RGAFRKPHPRPHPRQRHSVLAEGDRRLRGPVVLGGRRAGRGRRGRAAPAAARRGPYGGPSGPAAPAAGGQPLPPQPIPVGFTTFPGEIWRTPRSWVEASYPNVIYFNEVEKGGHFGAWEERELFSTEMGAAFKSLR